MSSARLVHVRRMDKPPAMQYADDVIAGRIVVCSWVRLSVERHLHDLEHGHERGLYFDEAAGWRIILFCSICYHYKGKFAGQRFEPEPWQQFFLWVLFGWKRSDGTRRFRIFHLEIARKNGKTFLGAAIGLYMTYADGEAAAEVYSVATKKDQARICHKDGIQIIKKSPALKDLFTILRDSISVEDSVSKFEPLGRDSDSLDGLNVSAAIMDELHAWKKRDLWDVIDTATDAREQALIGALTTAGFNRQTICWDHNVYLKKILAGQIVDDEFFGMIFTLDNEEEQEDESTWIKANPNLDVSITKDKLRNMIKRAQAIPSQLNSVLRLRLNIWTQAESRWIKPADWAACSEGEKEKNLTGRTCYGALDLSSTTDISSEVLVFPPVEDGGLYDLLCRFWIPEDNMVERSRRDRVPYDAFVRGGFVTATPGNVIDYDWIIDQVGRDVQQFDLQEMAFDRWGATLIFQQLKEILPPIQKVVDGKSKMVDRVVGFGQGFSSMSPPMKELEKLIISKKIGHGGNPILSWMADNVVTKEDPAGNIKPDKSKSIEKIDGIVALIMALDRALNGSASMKGSIYEERGLLGV